MFGELRAGDGATDSASSAPFAQAAARCCPDDPADVAPAASSSRRRRLWELEHHAFCPVVGVGLPIAALRRLYRKHCDAVAPADDYQLHCDAMAECRRRTALSDALQREFDRRYALALQQSARIRTPDALEAWWDEASRGTDLAGPVWATITHARCSPELQHRMLGEVHMRQHQVGAEQRVDLARFEATQAELCDAKRALAALHERMQRQASEHAREREHDGTQVLRARAELLKRDTLVATMREEQARALAAARAAAGRTRPVDDRSRTVARIAALEHALAAARAQIHRLEAIQRPAVQDPGHAMTAARTPHPGLDDRAVLCVGGRPASVPLYRRIIEQKGGRFLHHDGGEEQNVARLDATLAAADLVICQTGCISHDAYWRVKDHCKRTGKTCVFVENPGSASLRRALIGMPVES